MLECNYDGCSEQFEDHDERLAHSMTEHHTGLDPKDYPTLTGYEPEYRF